MNEPMHDLLAAAIDRRTHAFAEGRAFADAHGRRVVRAIRTRRVATYASVGSAAVAFAVGTGLGVAALGGTSLNLSPRPAPPPDPSMPTPVDHAHAATSRSPVVTTLVPVESDASTYPAGRLADVRVLRYAWLDGDVPFPPSGLWYPGVPDVPPTR